MNVLSFTTGVREGNARAPRALSRLLKIRPYKAPAARAEQIHGSHLVIVPKLSKEKVYPGADGLLTATPDQPLAIFTADCVPVFLSADRAGVVGLLHAGWRGVHGHILARAVRLMRRRWHVAPSSIRAWAGPSIGPCCFQVRWDTARYFPSTRRRSEGTWRVDLEGELRRQAKRLGIYWTSKTPSQGCTMHGSRYYSYRRDRTDKRQVSIIMMREQA